MVKGKLIYIPIVALFAFSMGALVTHYVKLPTTQKRVSREAKMPFYYSNRRVMIVDAAAEEAGIRIGDRLHAVDGREMKTQTDFDEVFDGLRPDTPVNLVMERKDETGETLRYDAVVTPTKIERDIVYYSKYIVGFLFSFLMPTVSILLGFWVLFVRPRDPLAWILLFVLLGLASFGIEFYWDGSLIVGLFVRIFFSSWAIAMLLFGIYFPERWVIDEKAPWVKWLFIVPLTFQVILTVFGLIRDIFSVNLVSYIAPLATAYGYIGFFINMIAIGLFFAALGYKVGTTKKPDARRRLSLMLYGTSLAITPTFLMVLYKFISRSEGPFFEIVPFWIGFSSLLLMLLFPLTMAYVIVVHRALDVGVVIRQGLQYALAKGGIRILQMLMLIGVGVLVWWTINRYGASVPVQLAFIVGGVSLVPLIEVIAKPLQRWIDKKFFREAYDSEQLLADLSDDVRTIVETKPLLETLSTKLSESLHVPQVALLLKQGDVFEPAYALGYDRPPVTTFDESAATVTKLKKNEPVNVYYDDDESWQAADAQELERLKDLNAQLLLPVGANNELSGIISLGPKLSEQPYSPNDVRLLKSVATQTGLALANSRLAEAVAREAAQKERINREVEIAREVQERLFPQELPRVDGLDYCGACRPAQGVGGDYYDFFELESGKIGIAIGDVSGKGIGASLMMASLQASLRGQAIHRENDLAGLMANVNRLVYETSTTNRYATFFYAQYDSNSRRLTYVNAGHNPPYLIRKKGDSFEVTALEAGGAVIGMLPPMLVNYEQGEVVFEPGDMLVSSTDGITEAMNPDEEEWGEEAFLENCKSLFGKNAREVIEATVAAADAFANGAKQHDDMTMIVLRCVAD